MRSVFNFPMLLPLVGLSAGIYLGDFLVVPISFLYFLVAISILTLLYLATAFVLKKFFLQWLPTIFIFLVLALVGYFFSSLTVFHFQDLPNKLNGAVVKITGYVEPGKSFSQYKANILLAQSQESTLTINSKMVLFVKKDSSHTQYVPGDILALTETINKPSAPLNAGQTNFRKIYRNKGIYYQCFAKQTTIKQLGHQSGYYGKLLSIKHNLVRILNENINNSSACGIVKAMLLGNTSNISDQIYESFATAGIVHILSVSGLHVGIILLLLERIFFFLNRNKLLKGIKLILIVAVLVFYAAITGFSAPVNRCVLMFSLIAVGRFYNNSVNIYNIIFAAAFILLLINPLYLFDAGFQLSFTAVSGIIWLYPIFQKYISTKYKLVNYVLTVVNVSLAAQLATLPLVLYHFGQFPLYFILSNLLAAPLSVFFLILGVATLALYWLPLAMLCINFLLGVSYELFISSITYFTKLPYAALGNLFLPEWIGWTLSIFILSIGGVFTVIHYHNKKRFLFVSFLCFMVLVSWYTSRQYRYYQTYQFVVFAEYGKNIMGIRKGKNLVLLETCNPINVDNFKQVYAKTGIMNVSKVKIPKNCVVSIGEYQILTVGKDFYPIASINYSDVNCIILEDVKKLPATFLTKIKKKSVCLLTGALPYYVKDKVKMQLSQTQIRWLDLMQTGNINLNLSTL